EGRSLPVPEGYPWAVFYDPVERILQVNQRVPALADIVLRRTDSKRQIAKRDADYFLRRLFPAIMLHTAQYISQNDLNHYVDLIVVNTWSRFFEKTSGKLKDAYVGTLKVAPDRIAEININRADPLLAFRNLGGAFVFSTDEIVPIEPQIRLDKTDKRFIEGK